MKSIKKEEEEEKVVEEYGGRGLTVPGHRYTGPFNALNRGEPNNATDRASRTHDYGYEFALRHGKKPYYKYNDIDEAWVKDAGNDPVGLVGKQIWGYKKQYLPHEDDKLEQQQAVETVKWIDEQRDKGHIVTKDEIYKKIEQIGNGRG